MSVVKAGAPGTPDVVLDVSVNLSLEVGRARMTIRDFLQLAPGSIVELDRPAGDPLDVYVNDRLVAHGEVVMVNDRYGVRFTEAVGTEDVRR
ncbi:MAG: flagellar motor switch protein FliN [Steroidobacteraceae bacterium]